MTRARVLLIEDEADIRALLRNVVEREGMQVIEAGDGREGLRAFYKYQPDLVVLDLGLPELDGLQVLERIRELGDVPVLILSARGSELDKVRGLRGGADDYLTKPFGRQELVARMEAIIRRAGVRNPAVAEVLADELLEIDFPHRRVTAAGNEVELTPTEFRLAAAFARHPDQVLSRDQILEMVWADSSRHSPDQVRLYVGYLRRKLRDASGAEPIETVHGFGYRYSPRR
ncbi:MAG TPA: response regulator transcription factor [Solirubrobacterales bacterium]